MWKSSGLWPQARLGPCGAGQTGPGAECRAATPGRRLYPLAGGGVAALSGMRPAQAAEVDVVLLVLSDLLLLSDEEELELLLLPFELDDEDDEDEPFDERLSVR